MPNIAQSCPHVNANELPVISAITPLCSPQFLRQREVVNIYEKPIALLQQSPGVFADYVIAHLRKILYWIAPHDKKHCNKQVNYSQVRYFVA
uniref:Uncharacterized protein n=1 Tax=Enterobacter agglomerans TaxID=549 RepID=O32596_ENTAG|nr:unknown [Pantoea agglomerans]